MKSTKHGEAPTLRAAAAERLEQLRRRHGAILVPLARPRCDACHRAASWRLQDARGRVVGTYCRWCAPPLLRDLRRREGKR